MTNVGVMITKLCRYSQGDKVLVLLPTSSSKKLAQWQGPFVVTQRVSDLDYEVIHSDRADSHQVYHINLLKQCREPEEVMLATLVTNEDDRLTRARLY